MDEPSPRLVGASANPAEADLRIPGHTVLRKGSHMITMYTTSWCGYCSRLKAQMQRSGLVFREVNIEEDPAAAEFVGSVNGGNHIVPTVVLPDGRAMTNPGINDLLAAVS